MITLKNKEKAKTMQRQCKDNAKTKQRQSKDKAKTKQRQSKTDSTYLLVQVCLQLQH